MRTAIDQCTRLLGDALGLESEAYGMVVETLVPLVEPLRQLAQQCESPSRHQEQLPSAAVVFDMLTRYRD